MTVTTNAPSGGGEAAVPPEDLVSLTIDGAASPIFSSLQFFREEYEQHIREGRCPFDPAASTVWADDARGRRGYVPTHQSAQEKGVLA